MLALPPTAVNGNNMNVALVKEETSKYIVIGEKNDNHHDYLILIISWSLLMMMIGACMSHMPVALVNNIKICLYNNFASKQALDDKEGVERDGSTSQQMSSSFRSVCVQSHVTYRRDFATPRFQVLHPQIKEFRVDEVNDFDNIGSVVNKNRRTVSLMANGQKPRN